MRASRPARGPMCAWRCSVFCGVLYFFLSAGVSYSQDVVEAARQEQARKAAQQHPARHVYTEEDLKRLKILTPEDQARVEAHKKQQPGIPGQQNAEQLPSNDNPQTESLGEVARRYRREKAAREAEQAEKKKFSPFPYKVPEDSLATPRPSVIPRVQTPTRVELMQPTPPAPVLVPNPAPHARRPHQRISPFQPRPLVVTPRVAAPAMAPRPRTPVASNLASVRPLIPTTNRVGLRRIQVERGESWWKLAKRYLGDGARWPELRAFNEEGSGPPEFLRSGSTVLVPEERITGKESGSHSIKLKKGDSLWSLAREYLGHGSAWNCLAAANPRITDYQHLKIGDSLQLPGHAARNSCCRGVSSKLRE